LCTFQKIAKLCVNLSRMRHSSLFCLFFIFVFLFRWQDDLIHVSDCTKWARVPAHGGLVFVDEILSILKCRNSDADSIQTVSTSTDPAHSGVAFVDEIFSILKCRNSDTETIKTVSTSSDGRKGCKYGASSEPDYVSFKRQNVRRIFRSCSFRHG